jgi:hypothetical protein
MPQATKQAVWAGRVAFVAGGTPKRFYSATPMFYSLGGDFDLQNLALAADRFCFVAP